MIAKDTLNAKVQSVLLSVITAAIIGCFSFLWNLNKTVAIIQERDMQRGLRMDIMQQGINDVRLDQGDTKRQVKEINDAVIRIEEHQNNVKR